MAHIRDNIERARELTREQTREGFGQDWRSVYAAVRCLEIVSEATRRLPPDMLARHPTIPWRNIQDAGNLYRHGYEVVEPRLIWDTIEASLPELGQVVDQELDALR